MTINDGRISTSPTLSNDELVGLRFIQAVKTDTAPTDEQLRAFLAGEPVSIEQRMPKPEPVTPVDDWRARSYRVEYFRQHGEMPSNEEVANYLAQL